MERLVSLKAKAADFMKAVGPSANLISIEHRDRALEVDCWNFGHNAIQQREDFDVESCTRRTDPDKTRTNEVSR